MPRSDTPASAEPGSRGEGEESAREEWLFYYDWFAGWRWEHHRSGVLVTESQCNFERKDDCMRDADEHRRRTLSEPVAQRVQ